MTSLLIVGGGLAGARCAETLRAGGFDGTLVLAGGEPHAPYERPALSKELLSGARDVASLTLRDSASWPSAGIALQLGSPVVRLDLARLRAFTRSGATLSYDVVSRTGVRTADPAVTAARRAPSAHARRCHADARPAGRRDASCDRGRRPDRRGGRIHGTSPRYRADSHRGRTDAARARVRQRGGRASGRALAKCRSGSPHRRADFCRPARPLRPCDRARAGGRHLDCVRSRPGRDRRHSGDEARCRPPRPRARRRHRNRCVWPHQRPRRVRLRGCRQLASSRDRQRNPGRELDERRTPSGDGRPHHPRGRAARPATHRCMPWSDQFGRDCSTSARARPGCASRSSTGPRISRRATSTPTGSWWPRL